jgi:membrane protease YdiL (CAAX protease family)
VGADDAVTAGSSPGAPARTTPPDRRPPGWKVGLALLSLALSLLLWLSGLVDSLGRPSVGGDLNLRQLELAVLAEPRLPPRLRPLLAGSDPEQALAEALAQQIEAAALAGDPAPAEQRLERALLLKRLGRSAEADDLLRGLLDGGSGAAGGTAAEAEAVRLARSLLAEDEALAAPEQWIASGTGDAQRPLLRVLSCEALAAGQTDSERCGADAAARRASAQLLAVTVLPALVLLLGTALLLGEIWRRWRGRSAPLPPLEAPPLGPLDAVLLIAGGFVVIGELLTPLFVTPALTALLKALAITSPLREGLSVLALYLALMAGPLLILALMLRSLGPIPAQGWLEFRWRPLIASLGPALHGLLLVLPLVSLVGWVQGQIWSDAGGSNPLLDLVLRSQDTATLACFGLTAIVLAPLFEETIFRGVLLPVAAGELGPARGVLLSAAVFAVAHLSLGELLPLFMLGLGLGWLRLSCGRLGSCVLMHALWNGLTFANLVLLGS